MAENNLQTVVDRTNGFNVVNAWITPNGELVVTLTHRNTDDEMVMLRVRGNDDVVLIGEDPVEWDDASTRLGRLNNGGNWND